ncbi:hypothetical protein KAFR_0E03110 [Kazachstania africana CBS 2517]|uniref:AB hydrolase-1 domain-containing protein n=1 Tax=Kazachstania africana (strain ATCC 22294 / BCRC 22015 / CBS 2517 / CECT 1963 / NBRC 1671 / NRRL Y-8276) TaxID=1071382 RepID=H2AVR3_KAZAF|nr:hypothetical protein KAFR_0E03110 [Kazachstania africana CBS 2517]CCF58463.1 hypothetical protein KAFR_0E03110 [Kazachstania africana CBS 2517]
MDRQELVENACDLEGQPLSGRSIHDIVQSYAGCTQLATVISVPNASEDFKTKFISKHEKYIDVNGIKVRVCHNVDRIDSDSLFLCIPGLGGNLEQFEPLVRLIDASNKNFLAIDLPGFGKSEDYSNYSMTHIATLIDQMLETVIGTAPDNYKINVMGHSMGTHLALHFYELFNKKYTVEKLILVSPPKPQIDQLAKNRTFIQFGLRTLFKLPWVFDFYRVWLDQSKGLQSSGIKQYFHNTNENENEILCYRKLWQFHNNIQIKSKSLIGYLLGWEAINWEAIRNVLRKEGNKTSIFVFCGENDLVTSLKDGEAIVQMFESVKTSTTFVRIPECSHNICFDQPEKFCGLFLDKVLKM